MVQPVLVTGANGFVGRALCKELVRLGFPVRAAVRSPNSIDIAGCEVIPIPGVDAQTDWSLALQGIDTVIHLAARVHVMHDKASNPLAEFRRVNLEGTEHLARAAVANGVRRLVYVSSIKVNGEGTLGVSKYSEVDVPAPQDPYGVSKWEAEQVLHQVAQETGLEVVIIRPPLVYGPGVKGNFAQMIKILAMGIPLPFGSVQNLRSLIYVENLVDALIACISHPAAVGQTYLVSDGEDVSTSDLLRSLGEAVGRPARIFSFPPALLKFSGRMSGKSAQVERLLGSLRVDISKIEHDLDWRPKHNFIDGLRKTGASVMNMEQIKKDRL